MSASIIRSTESSIFCPDGAKILIPLSWYGLCDALMTTPADARCLRVKNATPGVVMTPAERHSTPALFAPSISARSIDSPDSRVSRPRMICGLGSRSARCSASEKPIAVTVGESSGNLPASPRIPSVPKRVFTLPEQISKCEQILKQLFLLTHRAAQVEAQDHLHPTRS